MYAGQKEMLGDRAAVVETVVGRETKRRQTIVQYTPEGKEHNFNYN